MPQWRASLHVHTTPLPPLSPLEPTSPPLPSPLVFLPCTRSQHARALLADVGRRARASRLRNHVSEENLTAGYFLKIRDFKIRVGKQPPSPLLHPIRESRATPLDQIHSPTLGSTSIRYSLFLLGGCCAPICAPSSPFRLF